MRRMRLLQRLGQHVAQGDVEVLAVVLAGAVLEHREDRRTASSNTSRLSSMVRPNGSSSVIEALSPMPNSQRPLLKQVEHGDALGDAGGVVGGELEDAVAEPDVLGALAGGGEERLRATGSGSIPRGSGAPPSRRSRSRAGRPARPASARPDRACARRPAARAAAAAARRRCRTSSQGLPRRTMQRQARYRSATICVYWLMYQPPLGEMTWPVMNLASSLAR